MTPPTRLPPTQAPAPAAAAPADARTPGLRRYRLGCPLWALADWRGSLYAAHAGPSRFLAQYATVFNAVEGNTTFYAVPAEATVARWLAQVPATFRFCFKLPRQITHEQRLRGAGDSARRFLDRLRPLGERVGPVMVQLPASFGPDSLDALLSFLAELPHDFRFAVEVRRRAFFTDAARAAALDEGLREAGVERVILDSRALYGGDPRHPEVLAAEHPKPNLPVRLQPLTRMPLVRLVTHPDPATTRPWLERWAQQLADWVAAGLAPYVFLHCPDNRHSPGFARILHALAVREAARRDIDLGVMPPWPGEQAPRGEDQLTLL